MATKRKAKLEKAHILIADRDKLMVDVLKHALTRMGLTTISTVRSGREAISMMMQKPVDILITEWEMSPMDGLTLIKTLRQSENAALAMLPVIMLTGRAEMRDVLEARDKGTTEFLVKPFTAKTLYDRLEHVIDFPRDFIVSDVYIGPDRRRIKKTPAEKERRKTKPITISEPNQMPTKTGKTPQKIEPSFSLRSKLSIIDGLNSVITPEVLEQAQQQIQSFEESSLQWVARDMELLQESMVALLKGGNLRMTDIIKDALLSIKSHAGLFNFTLASSLAFSLYKFMRGKFVFGNEQHAMIAQKHVDVLKLLLAKQIKGNGSKLEQDLVEGLSQLTTKYQET